MTKFEQWKRRELDRVSKMTLSEWAEMKSEDYEGQCEWCPHWQRNTLEDEKKYGEEHVPYNPGECHCINMSDECVEFWKKYGNKEAEEVKNELV